MPIPDPYESLTMNPTAPLAGGTVVVPSDSENLTKISRVIYVGTSGDIRVTMKDGSVLTFIAVAAGTLLPVRASRVHATGTTATNLLALV